MTERGTGRAPVRGPIDGLGSWAGRYRGFEPDARRFLLVTLVGGAATSLWWIDFNLYLAALGFDDSRIGIIATAGSIASALAAFPASSLSDRIGRRLVMALGAGAGIVAVAGLIATANPAAILILAALYGAGNQAVQVVSVPVHVRALRAGPSERALRTPVRHRQRHERPRRCARWVGRAVDLERPRVRAR